MEPATQFKRASSSALSSRRPSRESRQLMRLALLDDLASREPKLAIRSLVALYDRQWGPSGVLGPATAAAELAILQGRKLASEDPAAAVGYYLTAAELAQDATLRAVRREVSAIGPRVRFAAELYNHSVARIVELAQNFESETGRGMYPLTVTGPLGSYTLDLLGDRDPWNPGLFQLGPADKINVFGLQNRHRIHGLGAPLAASRRELPSRAKIESGFFRSHQHFYPVTAVASFSEPAADDPKKSGPGRHRRATLQLHDPYISERIVLSGTSVPLEADFTAPLAILAETVAPLTEAQRGTFRAGRYLDESGLYLLEPFREDKIPLILVHGLQSSALTWLEMFNDLTGDAELRQRYQIWTFYYPTGLPFNFSAAILRKSVEETLDHFDPERRNPRLGQIVMVGHSMGGLLVRSQAIDGGNSLWNAIAPSPFESLELPDMDRDLLRSVYFPEPLPELGRAVFIATPHRGASLATSALGRLASSLIRLPELVEKQYRRLDEAGVMARRDSGGALDVIGLSSDNPILKAFEGLEIEVPFHTIVGDRSRDDDQVTDGLVTFESSKLLGAASEKIITAGHDVHKHPEAIAEVRRILIEHLRQVDAPPAAIESPR
ncbi:MAG: alpha/beta hydrolase [Acidobacteriota bacterium]